jgi:ADP-ribosyl-[dinitrogen reductase] hydrolase
MTDQNAAARDRAVGALLGLAVGDALGTTLEFSTRDALPWHSEITGGGPFALAAGVWTDDTSMALALADSLESDPLLDAKDLMDRFVSWYREGRYSPTGRCFDIGIATRSALGRYQSTGDPIAGSRDPQSAGNGSLMRLSPVAVRHHADEAIAMTVARRQSEATHAAEACVEACAWYSRLLVRAINGVPRSELLSPDAWEGPVEISATIAGGWRAKPREAIRSSGYVVHTLEAALWCVAQAESFEEAVVIAVNLADDADTVGAVTGQLAGALWGASAIPDRWRRILAWEDKIVAQAERLYDGGTP